VLKVHSLCSGFLSVHSVVNEFLALFRAGEAKGGEEEEWRPTSVTSFPGTSWLFNSHYSPQGYGNDLYLYLPVASFSL